MHLPTRTAELPVVFSLAPIWSSESVTFNLAPDMDRLNGTTRELSVVPVEVPVRGQYMH